MSLDLIPIRKPRERILGAWPLLIVKAISGDLVPRNPKGVPQSDAGSLGTSEFPWKRLYRVSGGLSIGQMKWVYTYNGLIVAPEGFMACDGRQITPENYYTEHPGAIAGVIEGSPILMRYMPNIVDRYLTSTLAATKNGMTPIPAVGANTTDFTHTHAMGTTSIPGYNGGNNGLGSCYTSDMNHTHTASHGAAIVDAGQAPRAMNVATNPESLVCRLYMRVI